MNTIHEEIERISMEIILLAGDARVDTNKALDAAEKFDFIVAQEYLKKAKSNIMKAHNAQTDTMQREIASEEKFPTNILFNHAQDTLMTIMSEINIAERLVNILKIVDGKLN